MKRAAFVLFLLSVSPRAQAQVVVTMTPEMIASAIASGANAKKDIGLYPLQERSGFGNGPLVGFFTTPFSRVARASYDAKRTYKPFTQADVTAEMVAPELHIYGTSTVSDGTIVNVEAIVVMPRKSKDPSNAIQPSKSDLIADEYKNRMGWTGKGRSMMAVFPLTVLSEDNEAHVVFDGRLPGTSMVKGLCSDCAVPFKLKDVR